MSAPYFTWAEIEAAAEAIFYACHPDSMSPLAWGRLEDSIQGKERWRRIARVGLMAAKEVSGGALFA